MASQWERIKWIPGTKLMVDGFRYQNPGCKSYLLTHFHSDHTTGLTRSFDAGLVLCTPITARLLRKDMGLPTERIWELPMDVTTVVEGTEVTPIDANHCPGACMFLLKTKATAQRNGQTILHTGDLRWSDSMAEHPALKGQRIDLLFLDTTYAKPTHTHPPQDQCIELMVKLMRQEAEERPNTLFVCGSYHIGKERAYLGAAKLLGWKVWCDANKRRVLKMLGLPDTDLALLTTKQCQARLHVDFLGALQPEKLQAKIDASGRWTHAVGFRPTGWTFRKSGKLDVREEGNVKVYGIPYSEHSSYTELRACVAALRPLKLIPTVNASNPNAARAIVNCFADLMDLSQDRSRLDFFLQKQRSHQQQADVCTPAQKWLDRDDSCARERSCQACKPSEDVVDESDSDSDGPCSQLLAAERDAAAPCSGHHPAAREDGWDPAAQFREDQQAAGGLKAEPSVGALAWVSDGTGALESKPFAAQLSMCAEQVAPMGAAAGKESVAAGDSGQHDEAVPTAGSSKMLDLQHSTATASRCLQSRAEPAQQADRAGSCRSTTEHIDLSVDVSEVDIAEQQRILVAITEEQKRKHTELASAFSRKRQATLAFFLK